MRKLGLPLLLLLLSPICSIAQVTSVTGTIVDPSGLPYAGGTLKAQLVLAGAGVNGTPVVTVSNAQQCAASGFGSAPCRVPFQGTVGPVTLDPTGSFSLSLQDNALVTPAATQWLFSVTISPGIPPPSGFGPQSCSATITITGAAQSVTSSFSCPALARSVSGLPGGSPGQTQVNNGGVMGGTACQTFPSLAVGPVSINCDSQFIGPNPSVDPRNFGASGSTTTTTGTINSGSSSLTLSAAIDFKNGQGVYVAGAGPTSALASPTCSAVAWGVGGATTYTYQMTAVDSLNGSSAPSANCPATNAAATLNSPVTVGISSITRTGGVVTVTTSAPHSFLVNADTTITTVTDASFNGMFRIETVPDNTHFTYNQRGTTGITSSGGNAIVNPSVKITVTPVANVSMYVLYGRTGGVFNFIRMVSPLAGGANTFLIDDFGNASAVIPPNIPSSAPVAATAGVLITTIVSGAGTTNLTIAATASNSVVGAVVRHDETAAINAAFASIQGNSTNGGGRVYFARGLIYQFGPLTLPAVTGNGLIMLVEGQLSPWTPLVINRSFVTITGATQSTQGISFQKSTASLVNHNGLSPVIYITNVTSSVLLQNLTISAFTGDAVQIGSNDGLTAPVSWSIEDCNLAATVGVGYGSPVYYAAGNGFGGSIWHGSYGGTIINPLPTLHFNGVAQIVLGGTRGGMGMTISSRGILFDGLGSPGGFDFRFENILTESNADPYFVRFDSGATATLSWANITLRHIEIADSVGNGNLNVMNWTYDNAGANLSSIFIDGVRGGVSLFNSFPKGAVIRSTDTPIFAGSPLLDTATPITILGGTLTALGAAHKIGNCTLPVNNTTLTVCSATAGSGALWVKALAGQSNDLFDVSDPSLNNYIKVDSGGATHFGTGPGLVRYGKFSATQTPALVGANTCAAQSFTFAGVLAADILITVNKPTEQAGLTVNPGHVTAANTLTLNFCNVTGASITPTAGEIYSIVVVQ